MWEELTRAQHTKRLIVQNPKGLPVVLSDGVGGFEGCGVSRFKSCGALEFVGCGVGLGVVARSKVVLSSSAMMCVPQRKRFCCGVKESSLRLCWGVRIIKLGIM